jgi:hypothetical protein
MSCYVQAPSASNYLIYQTLQCAECAAHTCLYRTNVRHVGVHVVTQKLSFNKPAEVANAEAQQAPLQCQRSGVKEIANALYSEPAKEFVKYAKAFVDEVTSVKLAEAQGLRRSNRRARSVRTAPYACSIAVRSIAACGSVCYCTCSIS